MCLSLFNNVLLILGFDPLLKKKKNYVLVKNNWLNQGGQTSRKCVDIQTKLTPPRESHPMPLNSKIILLKKKYIYVQKRGARLTLKSKSKTKEKQQKI